MSDHVDFGALPVEVPFGKLVTGADLGNLQDPETRERIRDEFERSGLLVFEDVEASDEMLLAVSQIFGPLKEHPVQSVNDRSALKQAPGVINLRSGPGEDQLIVEIDGKVLSNWLPWHFDLPYNDEINRASVLRPVVIAPDGGRTGFADGIDLYRTLPEDMRVMADSCNVIYTMDLLLSHMRFGRPPGFREIRTPDKFVEFTALAADNPRAIHPAVWTRPTGEKVLHLSTIHSVGVAGSENAQGDALLQGLCDHVRGNPRAYFHEWRPNQIVAWDNWRMLHCVTGTDPASVRQMHRTTVLGDYGLGSFEEGGKGGSELEHAI